MKKLILILFCFLFSCSANEKIKTSAPTATSLNCHFIRRDLKDLSINIIQFKNELDSFYESSWNYDFLEICIIGGGARSSFSKRWYQNEKNEWIFSENNNESILKQGFEIEQELLDNLSKGIFKHVCFTSFNHDSFLYLVKIRGEVYFGFSSSFTYPLYLLEKDKDAIKETMDIFSILKNAR